MNTIQIKNLRSFKDTGTINLLPINVLVGANSSGKSSFLRFFPLLKQSIETPTIDPILWYGDLVDFGNFKEAINRENASSHNIIIAFSYIYKPANMQFSFSRRNLDFKPFSSLSIDELQFILSIADGFNFLNENFEIKIELTLEQLQNQEFSIIKNIAMLYLGNLIEVTLNEQGKLLKLQINSQNFTHLYANLSFIKGSNLIPDITNYDTSVFQDLFTEFKDISKSYKNGNVLRAMNKLQIGEKEEVLQLLKKMSFTKTWQDTVSKWTINEPIFERIYNLMIMMNFRIVYRSIGEAVRNFSRNIYYITPLRASAQRYYRFQGLDVKQVDAQGQNLAMFFKNLSSLERRNFNNWLNSNFNIELDVPSDGGHLSLKLKQPSTNQSFNLIDMGVGFSQVMPILIQLWSIIYKKRKVHSSNQTYPLIYAIEQPELHLHPKLQAKLADIFMLAVKDASHNKIDLRLILETHSETMINRFGNQIAKNLFHNADINILIFDKSANDVNTTITQTGYDEEGFLKQWPYGFFEPED